MVAAGSRVEIVRIEAQPDGSILVEWSAAPGERFSVAWSPDLVTWAAVPEVVVATGSLAQWTDRGPPDTPAPPGATARRFYRVTRD